MDMTMGRKVHYLQRCNTFHLKSLQCNRPTAVVRKKCCYRLTNASKFLGRQCRNIKEWRALY